MHSPISYLNITSLTIKPLLGPVCCLHPALPDCCILARSCCGQKWKNLAMRPDTRSSPSLLKPKTWVYFSRSCFQLYIMGRLQNCGNFPPCLLFVSPTSPPAYKKSCFPTPHLALCHRTVHYLLKCTTSTYTILLKLLLSHPRSMATPRPCQFSSSIPSMLVARLHPTTMGPFSFHKVSIIPHSLEVIQLLVGWEDM